MAWPGAPRRTVFLPKFENQALPSVRSVAATATSNQKITVTALTGIPAGVTSVDFYVSLGQASDALALAATGLFSVVSYTVAQRTNEFGIRMALGANGVQVLRLVFASTATSVIGGIAGGVVLSLDRQVGDFARVVAMYPRRWFATEWAVWASLC